jgi:hypothetical protein
MTIGKTCTRCLGGGYSLAYVAIGEPPELVACDRCEGRGLLECDTCLDTGWQPVMRTDGHYSHDEPCHCATGFRVMHEDDTVEIHFI